MDDLMKRVNFRELGGYPSAAGGRVKANKLFRSGELSELKPEEVEYVHSLGLSFICDLRSEGEQQAKPNPVVAGVKNRSNPAMGGVVNMQNLSDVFNTMMANGQGGDPLLDAYKKFVTDPQSRQAYRTFVRSLLDSEGRPVLWHCTAGKDRTGFAAAIVLLLLEVPIETIVEDYMKSAACRQEANEKLLAKVREAVQSEEQLVWVRALLGVKPEYLLASLEEMRWVYGSTDNYIAEGLGISDEERKLLQEWYLE
ncbi:tyrosine-protein phosphatase [Paenibacillus sp. MZ04-78.2]|uniref:tyrosine-protein phosphatase n=1 Tax=Paenibacillus sp. MZ04-78.2 TaxID=2962034 RepID=UPI0020B6E97A|nr:tyrosine-protein phosphatase [Paenibacillus sp. MZ04-78.2]MCP3773359.1 tyrosine-protein phosphatase [Paenibacillus sp. MZ04-78.2]